MASADPYLFFGGNAEEAMNFYKSVFGGELNTMSYADMPPSEDGGAPGEGLMHANLVSGGLRIMASDSPKDFPRTSFGNPEVCINAEAGEEEQARAWFDALSEGADVRQPLEKMFWGDHFGQLTDKFGVQWMMNISAAAA